MCFKYLEWVNKALSCLGCSVSLNSHRFWRFYSSVHSFVFVSIEKIHQTLETVFHRLFKHLEFRQQYSAGRSIFNSLLGLWISRWNTVSRVWYITSRNERPRVTTFPNNKRRIENTTCSAEYFDERREMFGNAINHCGVFNISIFSVETRNKKKTEKHPIVKLYASWK